MIAGTIPVTEMPGLKVRAFLSAQVITLCLKFKRWNLNGYLRGHFQHML